MSIKNNFLVNFYISTKVPISIYFKKEKNYKVYMYCYMYKSSKGSIKISKYAIQWRMQPELCLKKSQAVNVDKLKFRLYDIFQIQAK